MTAKYVYPWLYLIVTFMLAVIFKKNVYQLKKLWKVIKIGISFLMSSQTMLTLCQALTKRHM